MYSADCAVGKAKCEYVTLKTFQVRNKMFPSFYNVRRFVAGIAFTWALLLVLMHERLLKQHHETEKSAVRCLIGCFNHIYVKNILQGIVVGLTA